jgi:hypothetical protein
MAKFFNTDVFDNGLNQIVNDANQIHLISNYTAGDSYATVTGNSLGNAALAGGDKTLSAEGTGRKVTTGAVSGTATATDASPTDLHFALIDTVNSKVLAVTDETTDQGITSGNTLNFPSLNWIIAQPA